MRRCANGDQPGHTRCTTSPRATRSTTTRDQPSPPATTAVVLVCWNNRAYLEPCLDSLYGAGLRHPFEVVVVDNGSTDGSQEMLRQRFPHVQLVQNDSNVGLGRASNQGIDATTAPFVLLLNNDTIVNRAALDAMVDYMAATPDAGAVGGKLLNEDGSVQAEYSNFSTLREEFLIATRIGERLWPGYPSHHPSDEIRAVDWLSSACLLVRRSALAQVGLLDESYFIYGDEADLQYRLIAGRVQGVLPASGDDAPFRRPEHGPVAPPKDGLSREDAVLPEELRCGARVPAARPVRGAHPGESRGLVSGLADAIDAGAGRRASCVRTSTCCDCA